MHNSNCKKGRRRWISLALFALLCVIGNAILNYALIPPSTVWLNLHNLDNSEQYDTLFIGTSHGQYCIVPQVVDQETGGSSVSLCMADVYPNDMYYLLKLACEKQKIKTVVYELDSSYWINTQRKGSTEIFFYKEFPASRSKLEYFSDKIVKLDFLAALTPWMYYRNLYSNAISNIKLKQSDAYKNYDPSVLDIPLCQYKGRGFLYRERFEGENKGTFNNIPWDRNQVKVSATDYFDRIVIFCQENDIQLIVITTPVPSDTTQEFAEQYQDAHLYFGELMMGYGLAYYDFNKVKPELIDRSMTGYWDYDGHMDGVQAETFSALLGKMLKQLTDSSFQYKDFFN